MSHSSVQHLLSEELEKRRLRNSAYSLRAFARDVGVSLTALSDVLNGRRSLSKRNLFKLSEALMLSPEESASLSARPAEANQEVSEDPYQLLGDDVFRVIGDWYYFAILNLAKLPEARANARWVAERLGLSVTKAEEALERLKRLGFVKQNTGKLERTARPIMTSRDIPSVAIRKHHVGNLRLAEEALSEVPVAERDFGSTIMPMNLEQMSRIKSYLQKVREKVADLSEKGSCSEIYCLSVQLFPLTKRDRGSVAGSKPKARRKPAGAAAAPGARDKDGGGSKNSMSVRTNRAKQKGQSK